jgi:hypothetical protein
MQKEWVEDQLVPNSNSLLYACVPQQSKVQQTNLTAAQIQYTHITNLFPPHHILGLYSMDN